MVFYFTNEKNQSLLDDYKDFYNNLISVYVGEVDIRSFVVQNSHIKNVGELIFQLDVVTKSDQEQLIGDFKTLRMNIKPRITIIKENMDKQLKQKFREIGILNIVDSVEIKTIKEQLQEYLGINQRRQLRFKDRTDIKLLLELKYKPIEIAKYKNVNIATLYKELNKGKTNESDIFSYCPNKAQATIKSSNRGKTVKLVKGSKLYFFIEESIIKNRFSPAVIEQKIKEKKEEFGMTISFKSIYNYIERGLFDNITIDDLSYPKKREEAKKIICKMPDIPCGASIEKRSERIDSRDLFGHWEMGSLSGEEEEGTTLLVLTERKTRYQIIKKMSSKTAVCVIKELDSIEEKIGSKYFKKIFKTITVDNGSEFSGYHKMRSSVFDEAKRTEIYYCHPYSAYERGSNENQNKLIRRFIKKGTRINKSEKEIKKIQNWMNSYPRQIFDWSTAENKMILEFKKHKIPLYIIRKGF